MLKLFRKDISASAAEGLYRAIVAQSRHPLFYADLGVADTPRGRFMAIALHVALVLRRLRREPEAAALGQALFDHFFRDMDRSLREMGVGDLSIGKKVGELARMFYGLLARVGEALDAGDRAGLAAALSRNMFEGEPNKADELAAYCEAEARALDALPIEGLMRGEISFRLPEAA